MGTRKSGIEGDRRSKRRFALQRDLRFKVVDGEQIVKVGTGRTIDISSRGIGFQATGLTPGVMVELAVSWPVLLDESCRMQLIVFGRVVRANKISAACTIDRYEFRTQGRISEPPPSPGALLRGLPDNGAKEMKIFFAHG